MAPIDTLTDIAKQYYRDGKIMRLDQIYWLCVPLSNRTYRRVAREDLESAISIIDAMSGAVHPRRLHRDRGCVRHHGGAGVNRALQPVEALEDATLTD